MRLDGYWHVDTDGSLRPVLSGTADDADGRPVDLRFMVDTGADVSGFTAADVELLGIEPVEVAARLSGVSGSVPGANIQTTLRFQRDGGVIVPIRVLAAALPLDSPFTLSVLGRDVLNLFAVIVDRGAETVILVRDSHRYTIHPS